MPAWTLRTRQVQRSTTRSTTLEDQLLLSAASAAWTAFPCLSCFFFYIDISHCCRVLLRVIARVLCPGAFLRVSCLGEVCKELVQHQWRSPLRPKPPFGGVPPVSSGTTERLARQSLKSASARHKGQDDGFRDKGGGREALSRVRLPARRQSSHSSLPSAGAEFGPQASWHWHLPVSHPCGLPGLPRRGDKAASPPTPYHSGVAVP